MKEPAPERNGQSFPPAYLSTFGIFHTVAEFATDLNSFAVQDSFCCTSSGNFSLFSIFSASDVPLTGVDFQGVTPWWLPIPVSTAKGAGPLRQGGNRYNTVLWPVLAGGGGQGQRQGHFTIGVAGKGQDRGVCVWACPPTHCQATVGRPSC